MGGGPHKDKPNDGPTEKEGRESPASADGEPAPSSEKDTCPKVQTSDDHQEDPPLTERSGASTPISTQSEALAEAAATPLSPPSPFSIAMKGSKSSASLTSRVSVLKNAEEEKAELERESKDKDGQAQQSPRLDRNPGTAVSHGSGAEPVASSSPTQKEGPDDAERCRLLYSKSKVYVHPSAWAKDNVPGFVAIVEREPRDVLLSWIPESLLEERDEFGKFVKVEEEGEGKGVYTGIDWNDEDSVLVKTPPNIASTHAFSVPIRNVYSLLIHPPTLSNWYGTVTVNMVGGLSLPTLHFHDDESRSTMLSIERSKQESGSSGPSADASDASSVRSMQTAASLRNGQGPSKSRRNNSTWGGADLVQRLRLFAQVHRSVVDPTLFLINPNSSDLETHSTVLFEDDAIDFTPPKRGGDGQSQPGPATVRRSSAFDLLKRQSILHQSMSTSPQRRSHPQPSTSDPTMDSLTALAKSTRFSILSSFSRFTRSARQATHQLVSHPLAQPIVPHLPQPVASFAHAEPAEMSGQSSHGGSQNGRRGYGGQTGPGEYDAARVYLAKWARLVAEEGERNRRREVDIDGEEDGGTEGGDLGVFELLATTANLHRPRSTRTSQPVVLSQWQSWFDDGGRLKVDEETVKAEIFRGGLAPDVRKHAWPFLLRMYEWKSSETERQQVLKEKAQEYYELLASWRDNPKVLAQENTIEERHRIRVDCRRTDRTQPLFALPTPGFVVSQSGDSTPDSVSSSPGAGGATESSATDPSVGAQPPTNEHVEKLQEVLVTYNFWEKELGYVQGMSDLASPIYVVMEADEVLSFWCFVGVMERMKSNFLRDQSGMMRQLLTLQQLIAVMDPELHRHLEKTGALHLFFCFRWLLIGFKREFSFQDVQTLWEVVWTDYLSPKFSLFVALAVLESHRDVIIRYLVEFDEILKYVNELSGSIELEPTLAQAEVLCLAFQQLVENYDRKRAEEEATAISSASAAADRNKLRKRPTTVDGESAGDGVSVSGTENAPSADERAEQSEAVTATGTARGRTTTKLPDITDNLRSLLPGSKPIWMKK